MKLIDAILAGMIGAGVAHAIRSRSAAAAAAVDSAPGAIGPAKKSRGKGAGGGGGGGGGSEKKKASARDPFDGSPTNGGQPSDYPTYNPLSFWQYTDSFRMATPSMQAVMIPGANYDLPSILKAAEISGISPQDWIQLYTTGQAAPGVMEAAVINQAAAAGAETVQIADAYYNVPSIVEAAKISDMTTQQWVNLYTYGNINGPA